MIEMKKIDKNKLPKTEVLATDGVNFISGYLTYDEDWNIVTCLNECTGHFMESVFYYMDLIEFNMEGE